MADLSAAWAPLLNHGKTGSWRAAKATKATQSETHGRIPIEVIIPQIFTFGDKYLKKRDF
jgi:hypothetical protein